MSYVNDLYAYARTHFLCVCALWSRCHQSWTMTTSDIYFSIERKEQKYVKKKMATKMKTMKNDAMKNTLVWLLLNDYHQSKEIFSLFLVYFNANCFDITTINELVLHTDNAFKLLLFLQQLRNRTADKTKTRKKSEKKLIDFKCLNQKHWVRHALN